MSSLWPHAHGALCFGEGYDTLRPGVELLIDRLQDAGYHVGYEGIWHIRRPPEEERSSTYAWFRPCSFPYQPHRERLRAEGRDEGEASRPVRTPKDDGTWREWRFSVPVPARWAGPLEEHPDMACARSVADFIRRAPVSRPLAVWCSFAGPHPPLLVPEPYASLFSPEDIEPPPNWDDALQDAPRAVVEAPGRQAVRDWTWPQWACAIAAYRGYVAFLDACFGVVLEALEETGRLDETLIVATTDHGEMLGAHRLYQKGVLYDEAIRLPWILAGPDIVPGRRDQLVSQVDLAPTVLEWLGLPPLSTAQGESLTPILRDPEAPGRECIFAEFDGYFQGGFHLRCAITSRYKYIWAYRDGEQLFDRQQDPHELHNRANDASLASLRADLRARLRRWMEDTDDFLTIEEGEA
jgi:arylsulfatase A-like enzyme